EVFLAVDAKPELSWRLDLERDAIGAALELDQDLPVDRRSVRLGQALADLPSEPCDLAVRPACERRRAGQRRIRGGGVTHIDRLDANPVGSLGDELLLEIGALDRLVDEGQPRLARRRRKSRGKLRLRGAVSAGRHGQLYLVQIYGLGVVNAPPSPTS